MASSSRDDDESNDNKKLTRCAATMQILSAVTANMTLISTGMGLVHPSVAADLLLEPYDRAYLTQSQVSWFASITAIACPIGALFSGMLAELIGRKGTLIFIDVISIISWLLIAFASRSDSDFLFIQLMIARFIIGSYAKSSYHIVCVCISLTMFSFLFV